jgi:hypothetical protein
LRKNAQEADEGTVSLPNSPLLQIIDPRLDEDGRPEITCNFYEEAKIRFVARTIESVQSQKLLPLTAQELSLLSETKKLSEGHLATRPKSSHPALELCRL